METAGGSTFSVAFEFSCLMLPETYFGFRGSENSIEMQLHRVLDFVAIHIASEPMLLSAGRFDISHMVSVEVL